MEPKKPSSKQDPIQLTQNLKTSHFRLLAELLKEKKEQSKKDDRPVGTGKGQQEE